MNEIIKNGDYALENGAVLQGEYREAVLQDIARAIKTRLGAFYPDKNYGSRLDEINSEPALLYALCFARCAVYCMDGVYITKVDAVQGGFNFSVSINNEKKEVFVEFEHNL